MKTTRRSFLWCCGSVALAGETPSFSRAADSASSELATVSRTGHALGTEVSIKTRHADGRVARAAVKDAFEELEHVENLLSIYRDDSEISRLNRCGVLSDPHPFTLRLLREATRYSRLSGGAFDITVQPLWSLYSQAKRSGQRPDNEQIQVAQSKVDWRRVEFLEGKVRLRGKGTAITLNGIAQGFAADRAKAALQAHGVEHAMIDTGEVGTIGPKKPGVPWSVGIQHPRQEDAYLSVAKLRGRSLATSGDYATHFTPDRELNHLFDPTTGRSPTELASVSICAPTSMDADALSTATFVLGAERAAKLISKIPDVDALMVDKNGKTFVTRDFPLDV